MARAADLRLVNPVTGEISREACPRCFAKDEEIATLTTEKRGWSSRYHALKRDVDGAYQDHDLFPRARRLFNLWRDACNHPRSKFTAERFELCRPHIKDESDGGAGEELCRRAIEGAAYEPFKTIRRNGSTHRHDGWDLIFRSRDKLEDFANRAPFHLPDPAKVKVLAAALAFVHGWELERAVPEAQARLKR